MRCLSAAALLALLLGATIPAPAIGAGLPLAAMPQSQQQEQAGQQQAEQGQVLVQPPAGEQVQMTREEAEALALVEQILREEEGVLMGQDLSYDPAGRRDPFRSLLTVTSGVIAPSTRPFGLPGFLINEVELKAIANARGRWKVMLIGPDQKAYFAEVGSELFDGHIVEIRPGEVIFEQVIADLMGARRTREVVKTLRGTGGSELPQP